MKSNYLNQSFIIVFMAAILFGGCAKDGATGPAGPAGATGVTGPIATGNLFGYVKKWDQYGSAITTDLSGVSVNLTGGSFNLNTTTDSTGKYSFDNITTGYYTLKYTDSLFGFNQVNYNLFLGGATVPRANVNMSKIPNFYMTALAFTDTLITNDSSIVVTCTLNASDNNQRAGILYVGTSAGVSSNPATYLNYYTKNITALSTTFKVVIPLSDLYNLGFTPGQTVYFAGYGISLGFNTNSSYEDFVTGRSVFTAISTTAVTSSHIIP